MTLRDAFYFQLEEYIKPLEPEEYERFHGAAGNELEKLMKENQDVLRFVMSYVIEYLLTLI